MELKKISPANILIQNNTFSRKNNEGEDKTERMRRVISEFLERPAGLKDVKRDLFAVGGKQCPISLPLFFMGKFKTISSNCLGQSRDTLILAVGAEQYPVRLSLLGEKAKAFNGFANFGEGATRVVRYSEEDEDPEILRLFATYVNTGDTSGINESNVLELLGFSDYVVADELKEFCLSKIGTVISDTKMPNDEMIHWLNELCGLEDRQKLGLIYRLRLDQWVKKGLNSWGDEFFNQYLSKKDENTDLKQFSSLTVEQLYVDLMMENPDGLRILRDSGIQFRYLNFFYDAGNSKNILNFLSGQPVVELLHIRGNIGSQSFRDLLSIMHGLVNLTCVDLSNIEIGDEEVEALAAVFLPNLTCLCLSFQNIIKGCVGAKGTQALVAALSNLTHLTYLHLQDIQLNMEEVKMLVATLGRMPNLVKLGLNYNGIDDAGAQALAAAFVGLPKLTTLLLSGNKIGNEGAQALVAAFAGLPNLTRLYFLDNRISDEEAKALRIAFKNLPNPHHLARSIVI